VEEPVPILNLQSHIPIPSPQSTIHALPSVSITLSIIACRSLIDRWLVDQRMVVVLKTIEIGGSCCVNYSSSSNAGLIVRHEVADVRIGR
jgi:hypothetical protein